MSYYKITYESNTVEGLKAIQNSYVGLGTSASGSTSEDLVTPPPFQPDEENADAFSGIVQAPPATNEDDINLDFSDENAIQSPPPTGTDLATTHNSLGDEIQPPPEEKLSKQESNEGVVPPKQSTSNSSKSDKKSSK